MKKQFFANILSRFGTSVLLLALVALMTSCDSVIYDYEEDCEPGTEQPGPDGPDNPGPAEPDPTVYYVQFKYLLNMQNTDGFSNNVNAVDLYVFNTSGTFVTKYHEEGAPLTQEGYLMELTDLPAGTYHLIAWCGSNGYTNFFTIPSVISNRSDVTAELNTENGVSKTNLPALFHGQLENAVYNDDEGAQIHTILLTKDTNNINITLQHKSGLEFTKERFQVTLTDNNGYMLANNSVPSSNEMVEYLPFKTSLGTTRAETMGNFLNVELATSRLMTDHAETSRITVIDTENNDKVIFSIPLVKWAIQLRSSEYKKWEDQEYLDREDHFNLMLWLDSYDPETGEDEGWFGADVEINDWHVIDDELPLQ